MTRELREQRIILAGLDKRYRTDPLVKYALDRFLDDACSFEGALVHCVTCLAEGSETYRRELTKIAQESGSVEEAREIYRRMRERLGE